MEPIFEKEQIEVISEVFKASALKMATICGSPRRMESYLEKKVPVRWDQLWDEGSTIGSYGYETFTKNPQHFTTNKLLDVGPYVNQLYLYKENLPELKAQFQFKVSC